MTTATAKKRGRAAALALMAVNLQLAKGERYRGLVLDENGKPSHHLIFVGVTKKAADHATQQKWAESLGADLAEKHEGWLLVAANADGAIDKAKGPYWLKPQYAGNPECAWTQYFTSGYQYYWHKSYKLHAVAVRRVAIR